MSDIENVARLLREGEGPRVEFKSESYSIVAASDSQKAELVKDIVAMANAWRNETGYILTGVQESSNGTGEISGVLDHTDDATLQQLVNSKINRPIDFNYFECAIEGKTVGVFQIPVQRRPFFLRRPFGGLSAGTTYIRRGTSTDIADPEEVAQMRESELLSRKPNIRVAFADTDLRRSLGDTLPIECVFLTPLSDDCLPTVKHQDAFDAMGSGRLNNAYWEELSHYVWNANAFRRIGFVASNAASTIAMGVRAIFRLRFTKEILLADQLAAKPERRLSSTSFAGGSLPSSIFAHNEISFERHGDDWHIEIEFGKIQPGAYVWTSTHLWIACAIRGDVILEGQVFTDNAEPTPARLTLASAPGTRTMTLEELEEADQRHEDGLEDEE